MQLLLGVKTFCLKSTIAKVYLELSNRSYMIATLFFQAMSVELQNRKWLDLTADRKLLLEIQQSIFLMLLRFWCWATMS